jgi:hypothetical protein
LEASKILKGKNIELLPILVGKIVGTFDPKDVGDYDIMEIAKQRNLIQYVLGYEFDAIRESRSDVLVFLKELLTTFRRIDGTYLEKLDLEVLIEKLENIINSEENKMEDTNITSVEKTLIGTV